MNTLVTAPENQSRPNGKPRRRWVKVDVDEESFQNLHLMAAHSLMRIQPYLRRFLAEARPYPDPGGSVSTPCSSNPAILAASVSSPCRHRISPDQTSLANAAIPHGDHCQH